MQIVGWGKRSAPHHPEASDSGNIKRHQLFMDTLRLPPPYALRKNQAVACSIRLKQVASNLGFPGFFIIVGIEPTISQGRKVDMSDDKQARRKGQFMPPLSSPSDASPRVQVFGGRGRVIVDEIEAHDIMSHAYRSDATGLSQMAQRHSTFTQAVAPGGTGSRMRDLGDLLYRAGRMDPNTQMQHQLNFSNNKQLQGLPFIEGGGFVAKELSRFVPPSERNPSGKFVPSQRDVEFHPPGGRHNAGNHTDLHGSYVRPATQPNEPKPRERSFSAGSRIPEH
jgi:hypothetical protein